MLYKKPEIKSYSAGDLLEEMGPCQNQYTVTLSPAADDWINREGGNYDLIGDGMTPYTNWPLIIGDGDPNDTQRILLSFNINNIPQGSTIVSATLRVYQTAIVAGNPYGSLGGSINVAHVDVGAFQANADDYSGNVISSNLGAISNNADLGWKELAVTSAVQVDLDANRNTSQFRLYFPIESDNAGDDDETGFGDIEGHTGNGTLPAGFPPQLVVTYRL